jgi:hypothetical protein
MPGVIEVNRKVPLKTAIDDILLIAEICKHGEFQGQIIYLPLAK